MDKLTNMIYWCFNKIVMSCHAIFLRYIIVWMPLFSSIYSKFYEISCVAWYYGELCMNIFLVCKCLWIFHPLREGEDRKKELHVIYDSGGMFVLPDNNDVIPQEGRGVRVNGFFVLTQHEVLSFSLLCVISAIWCALNAPNIHPIDFSNCKYYTYICVLICSYHPMKFWENPIWL